MPPRLVILGREFNYNMVSRKKTTFYVRGKWVSFHKDEINQLLKLGKLSDGTKFKKLEKDPNY